MKTWTKVLLGVALSLLCLFTTIGYADLTTDLTVVGEAEATPPEALYITAIVPQSASSGASVTINYFTNTVVNSRVNLGSNGRNTVTYRITVFNNTDVEYGYNAMIYTVGEGTFDNTNIKVVPNIQHRESVPAHTSKTFDVTVSYKNTSSISNTVLNSVIIYEFLPMAEIPESDDETAVGGVLSQFENILNNRVEGQSNTYETLDTQMKNNTDNDRIGENGKTYIGNVEDASDKDKEVLNKLFAGQLSLNINGEDMPVTILIKSQNVDGQAGNEMVIYMTTDDLVKSSTWRNENAPVYVAAFKQVTRNDGTTEWIRQGDMYLGEARITSYNGFMGNGSFNTDTWETDEARTYTVTSQYSYTVASGQSMANIMQVVDANARNELARLILKASEILADGRYSGNALLDLVDSLETYQDYYNKECSEGRENAVYGLNLFALTGGKTQTENYFKIDGKTDTKDCVLLVFNFLRYQEDLQFECISFICTVVRECSSILN